MWQLCVPCIITSNVNLLVSRSCLFECTEPLGAVSRYLRNSTGPMIRWLLKAHTTLSRPIVCASAYKRCASRLRLNFTPEEDSPSNNRFFQQESYLRCPFPLGPLDNAVPPIISSQFVRRMGPPRCRVVNGHYAG
jgi:hypothetical protein